MVLSCCDVLSFKRLFQHTQAVFTAVSDSVLYWFSDGVEPITVPEIEKTRVVFSVYFEISKGALQLKEELISVEV